MLKIKSLTSSYKLEVKKWIVSLRVTNSKLKNKKFHFELLLDYSYSIFFCLNEILYNSDFFEMNISMSYYRRPFISCTSKLYTVIMKVK